MLLGLHPAAVTTLVEIETIPIALNIISLRKTLPK
jgi:hypothetical protein